MKKTLLALLSTALVVGCSKNPTEIVVTIDTTFSIPCTIDTIVVDVTTSAGETQTETVFITEDALPGSLTLIADGAVGQLTIAVTGKLGETTIASAEQLVEFEEETSREVRFLLDPSCSPGPCEAAAIGEFTSLPAAANRLECGQERYTTGESLALLTNACSAQTLGTVLEPGDDELEIESPLDPQLPFPFFFFGRPVSKLWVGDNGYLAFTDEAPRALNNNVGDPRSLGESGGFPAPGILPFWDKLVVGEGVCFAVTGSEPNRTMWVTWDRTCFGPTAQCGGPDQGTLTFSVGLEESTNNITVGYHTMQASGANLDRAKGQSGVIGITRGSAPGCAASACDDDGLCPNGDACGYREFSALTTSLDANPLPQIEFRPVVAE